MSNLKKEHGLNLYTVVDKELHKRIKFDDFQNQDLNILIQAHRGEYDNLKKFKNIKLLVDSGAYAFNYGGVQSRDKLDKFLEKYIHFVEKTHKDKRIRGYFEIDVMELGLRKILEYRRRLLNITPKIIPVYHSPYGLNEFKRMCHAYDKIAICYNDYMSKEGHYKMVKYAHKHDCAIHGLGTNNNKFLQKIPYNSVDSATWVTDALRNYYYHSDIEKNKENNKIYRPMFERQSFLKQVQRQKFYKNYWKTYFNLLYGES